MEANEVTAPNAGIAQAFQCGRAWPGVGEFGRSAAPSAQQAQSWKQFSPHS